MAPQAWPEWVNAYNSVKPGDKVYKNGELLGVASGVYARCTATSPGRVCLTHVWISGLVTKKSYGWECKC